MNVGLPGTGIGGIFYLLSVFIILGVEICMIAMGKSNRKRQIAIREQVLIVLSMILIAVLTNYVLTKFVFTKPPLVVTQSSSLMGGVYNFYLVHPIFVPITLLIVVLLMTHVLHLFLATRAKYQSAMHALN